MVWYAWIMAGVLVLSGATVILTIGREREPLTPAVALMSLIINGLLVWGVIELAT